MIDTKLQTALRNMEIYKKCANYIACPIDS